MADKSLLLLTLVIGFWSLASSVTNIFLPNYFLQVGLSINQIILFVAMMVTVIGMVPLLTLKFFPKIFEKLLILGLILGMLLLVLLTYVTNPLVLGFVKGLSTATFWPAANLLFLKFTRIKKRGLLVCMLFVIVPTAAGILGPLLGGVFINFLGFNSAFLLGIVFLIVATALALKIKYTEEVGKFDIPKTELFFIFGLLIILSGFADPGYLPYPLFLHSLAGGYLQMGIVAAIISAIFAVISFVAGKTSKVERYRITFALVGALMTSVWLISLAFVQTVPQLIGASVFSGISNAFGLFLFSLYGDFFKRKQHATLIVLWEVFLMTGRLGNLIPVGVYMNSFDFKDYFLSVGLVSLIAVVLFLVLGKLYSTGKISTDSSQK